MFVVCVGVMNNLVVSSAGLHGVCNEPCSALVGCRGNPGGRNLITVEGAEAACPVGAARSPWRWMSVC